jgi:hypothetical protein
MNHAIEKGCRALRTSVLGISTSLLMTSPAAAESIYQLRIYEIFDRNATAFHARFRDHALRIMRNYEFDVVSTWETRAADKREFVYVVRWPDEATMKDRWAKFMADEEWSQIKDATSAADGRMVGEIQERILHRTDYSPDQWR